MNHILNESPIHIIDALTKAFSSNSFEENEAIIFGSLLKYLREIDRKDNDQLNKVALTDAKTTYNEIFKIAKSLTHKEMWHYIDACSEKEYIKNQLILYKNMLLKMYDDAGIDWHNDKT